MPGRNCAIWLPRSTAIWGRWAFRPRRWRWRRGTTGSVGRRRRLHQVVAMSRFLIRPQVHCRYLASKVLGMALRRLPGDFERLYGYRPVLAETFVESSKHADASLAASNWIRVGQTKGRGRFAAAGAEVPVKAVWLRPLAGNWRQQLGLPRPLPVPARGPGDGLDREHWAQNEFGGAPLGDVRLSRRLVKSAAIQAASPMASFPAAAQGEKAAVARHYRMIDQPAASAVSPENILVPHRARTRERMQGADRVLCIQDGTDLNLAEHPGCAGWAWWAGARAVPARRDCICTRFWWWTAMASRWACRTSSMTRRTGRRRGANRRRNASRSAGCAGCANVLPWRRGWTACARWP